MGSLRVGLDWATSLSLFTFMHWRRKWQPTPVFLPGASQGRGAWWAAVYEVAQSWTRLKRLSGSSKKESLVTRNENQDSVALYKRYVENTWRIVRSTESLLCSWINQMQRIGTMFITVNLEESHFCMAVNTSLNHLSGSIFLYLAALEVRGWARYFWHQR